jgi:hypothetical protein
MQEHWILQKSNFGLSEGWDVTGRRYQLLLNTRIRY